MQQASYGPVHEALDGIVFRAILWFVAAAAITAFPLLLSLPPIIHLAAHAVLPASWALYAAIVWWRERGRPHLETDQWPAAAAIDPGGAVAAQMAAVGLPIGWVAAAAGLLSHHFATSPGTAQALAVDFPILAVTLLLAQLAWRASCQRALADAMAAPTMQGGPNKLRASKR